jgi:hypothetical protein
MGPGHVTDFTHGRRQKPGAGRRCSPIERGGPTCERTSERTSGLTPNSSEHTSELTCDRTSRGP